MRESSGGLPGVQALGLLLGDGSVQVSTNVIDLEAHAHRTCWWSGSWPRHEARTRESGRASSSGSSRRRASLRQRWRQASRGRSKPTGADGRRADSRSCARPPARAPRGGSRPRVASGRAMIGLGVGPAGAQRRHEVGAIASHICAQVPRYRDSREPRSPGGLGRGTRTVALPACPDAPRCGARPRRIAPGLDSPRAGRCRADGRGPDDRRCVGGRDRTADGAPR